MMTIKQLVEHLAQAALQTQVAADRETRILMEEAAVEAKALIGHELEEWPALSPSTIAEKQRLGYTGQISETDPLLRTGHLRDSIKGEADTIGLTTEGVVGSDDIVAFWQECGTTKIPPRPFLAPSMVSVEPRSKIAFGELAVRALTPGKRL